jgi:hypothetical protein
MLRHQVSIQQQMPNGIQNEQIPKFISHADPDPGCNRLVGIKMQSLGQFKHNLQSTLAKERSKPILILIKLDQMKDKTRIKSPTNTPESIEDTILTRLLSSQ